MLVDMNSKNRKRGKVMVFRHQNKIKSKFVIKTRVQEYQY